MKLLSKHTLFIILVLFALTVARSHGYLSHQIKAKTVEISKDPKNPALYFERGYLYQLGDHFTKATEDYIRSEKLGLNNKLLHFRKTEVYYGANKLQEALTSLNLCLKIDSLDVKTYKLKSKLLLKLKHYHEAKIAYEYVLKNTADLKPEDYINYSTIILSINPENYSEAIAVLDSGIEKSGTNVVTFQLKKLEYLKNSNQLKKVLELYNSMIESSKRKEFLYYEKAIYLFENCDNENSNIALQQAKLAIVELNSKYLNTEAIIKLHEDINILNNKLQL